MAKITKSPADPELAELQRLTGLTGPQRPPGREPFTGDFRTQLTRYLYQQRMGTAGIFRANPGVGLEERQFLARVEVPDHMATQWTITLSPGSYGTEEQVEGVFPDDILRAYAAVEFGVAGQRATVEVDWRQGARFEIAGSSISLEAVFPGVTLPGAPQGWPIKLSGSIVPGRCPTPMPVTRTVYYELIDIDSATTLPVPRFARRVRVQRAPVVATDTYRLLWRRGDGTGLLQHIEYANSGTRIHGDYIDWLPVPPAATFLRIQNLSVSRAMPTVIAIYELQV